MLRFIYRLFGRCLHEWKHAPDCDGFYRQVCGYCGKTRHYVDFE